MSVLFTRRGAAPSLGKLASDYAVGESVFLNVNGTAREFLVVHQGKPSSLYDDSCDGIWLLMKDVYENRVWDSSDSDYANSDIHAYLNGTFFGLFDANVQSAIQQVKIPYRPGTSGSTVNSGANGLSAQIFLLSNTEVNYTGGSTPANVGAVLSYFSECTTSTGDTKRVAYMNGTVAGWWLRSPYTRTVVEAVYITAYGNQSNMGVTYSNGIRPALILPSNTRFDPETNEFLK